eukprot:scaffold197039_cov34-Tisochrysis_lutea.AAC.2
MGALPTTDPRRARRGCIGALANRASSFESRVSSPEFRASSSPRADSRLELSNLEFRVSRVSVSVEQAMSTGS